MEAEVLESPGMTTKSPVVISRDESRAKDGAEKTREL